ncbi:MAG: hypothetical protein M1838_005867 [Thelocarpon superellum]|nr:MAG: hypothetical protein M1838_005867 [Thelocarpon superellum]
MGPRQPERSDFPAHLELSVTPPLAAQPASNVLILLHGLGDTNASFTALGRTLALPDTTCIALQGPAPLPFNLDGFHWGDDIMFDQATGNLEFDTGFTKAVRVIAHDVIQAGLIDRCGYRPREIVFFGFGQGGMVALAVAAAVPAELGGVISIGGPLPSSVSASATSGRKAKTPIQLLGGSSNTLFTPDALARISHVFNFVEYHSWERAGDSMPSSRDETLPIMQFFARRLRSQQGVPEGSMEIS